VQMAGSDTKFFEAAIGCWRVLGSLAVC
jgi:hypothetical protein